MPDALLAEALPPALQLGYGNPYSPLKAPSSAARPMRPPSSGAPRRGFQPDECNVHNVRALLEPPHAHKKAVFGRSARPATLPLVLPQHLGPLRRL